MFTDVDHLGFAVRDLDEAMDFYGRMYDITDWDRIPLPERHMVVACAHVGDTMLELMAPTSDEAAFAKFLAERGPSFHHVAYRVDDVNATLAELKARGVQLIDEQARPSIHNTLVAFLHPKSTMGVLIELVQHQ